MFGNFSGTLAALCLVTHLLTVLAGPSWPRFLPSPPPPPNDMGEMPEVECRQEFNGVVRDIISYMKESQGVDMTKEFAERNMIETLELEEDSFENFCRITAALGQTAAELVERIKKIRAGCADVDW